MNIKDMNAIVQAVQEWQRIKGIHSDITKMCIVQRSEDMFTISLGFSNSTYANVTYLRIAEEVDKPGSLRWPIKLHQHCSSRAATIYKK